MFRKLFLGICILLGAVSLSMTIAGCETTEGFGKDVEKAGEKIQDAAD